MYDSSRYKSEINTLRPRKNGRHLEKTFSKQFLKWQSSCFYSNSLLWVTTKKTQKLHITSHLSQRVRDAENASISWRHHMGTQCCYLLGQSRPRIGSITNRNLFPIKVYLPYKSSIYSSTYWGRDKMAAILQDDIFKSIVLHENCSASILISL